MTEVQQAIPAQPPAMKIWRMVDKDGNPVCPTKFPIIETLFGNARKTPAQPLNLQEKLTLANQQNPAGAPHQYRAFVEEKVVTVLEQAVQHWKANHANQVERSRVLLERTDLPLERVRAYATIGRLQDENAELRRRTK